MTPEQLAVSIRVATKSTFSGTPYPWKCNFDPNEFPGFPELVEISSDEDLEEYSLRLARFILRLRPPASPGPAAR